MIEMEGAIISILVAVVLLIIGAVIDYYWLS